VLLLSDFATIGSAFGNHRATHESCRTWTTYTFAAAARSQGIRVKSHQNSRKQKAVKWKATETLTRPS